MPDPPAMDLGSFPPPEKFTFDPRDWPTWESRFARFRQLSNLSSKPEEFQINALIYTMGEQADEIFLSFNLSASDKKIYAKVLEAFQNHFVGKRNVMYERARFGVRRQEEGESIESFVTSLHTLSQHCDYANLRESLVRDRIILGVRDKKLSEKLMLTTNLDLPKAIEIAKQWESVKRQQGDLNQDDEKTKNLDNVQKGKSSPANSRGKVKVGKCKYCGREHEYLKSACPAVGKTCNLCKKKDHFQVCCPEKQNQSNSGNRMNNVNSTEGNFDMEEINEITSDIDSASRSRRWTAKLLVDSKLIEFKLDPGADVTAIPYYTFKKIWKNRRLFPAEKILSGPDGSHLAIVGTFTAILKSTKNQMKQTVFVVRGLQRALLGVQACEELGLVQRLDNLASSSQTKVNPQLEFPELFKGLGKMEYPYTIKLKTSAQPFALHTPRRVPIPLMDKVKKKLQQMIQQGVIESVDEPTEWCAPLVTVPKPNGDIRLCVDLTALNRSVEREYHPMPVIEHTMGQMAGARIFSKLDANSGFYQIVLSPECKNLTTFITPFGRFRYKRLPFGISSAPEHFQKRMMEILKDIPGVSIHIDDVLVFGSTQDDHDARLRQVLNKLKNAGVTLNAAKCQFGTTSIQYLGHIIDERGVQPDPEKIEAITNMPPPTNVTETKRFLGMINFIGRFIPHLSTVSKPLYELTHHDREFMWGPTQEEAFRKVKEILTQRPILVLFDPNKETVLSSDASSYGLGSVLLQKQDDDSLKPVAYASRTMSSAEKRYAQIEKEALAITWACERFRDFLTGKEFMIETDHKPLLPILTTKSVDDLSPRLQRFRIRMMRYSFQIKYTPGKQLLTTDALSRQPLSKVGDTELEEDVSAFVCHVMSSLPSTDGNLSQIWKAQQEDTTIQTVIKYCVSEWPEKASEVEPILRKYWSVRHELSLQNGVLLRNCRLVIPKVLQPGTLSQIHAGHLGITKCRSRARQACWWPGISEEIAEMVQRCPICVKERKERNEPLIPSKFPTRPWQRLGMDLFKSHGKWFILVVDYFSRYPEVAELSSMSTAAAVKALKTFFSRHGVPEEIVSDNGPQFHPLSTSPFQKFAREYGFIHTTSSPHYPQSNGFVENGVKIIKNLFQKNADWYMALLEYRATPLHNGYSPAELLMGRRLRTTLAVHPQKLIPQPVDQSGLRQQEEIRIQRQRTDFNRRHGVIEKSDFIQGEIVWIKDLRIWGKIAKSADAPRSYVVTTSRGEFRRNSSHLTRAHTSIIPEVEPEIASEDQAEEIPETRERSPAVGNPVSNPQRLQYQTRSGRVVQSRRRLIEEI